MERAKSAFRITASARMVPSSVRTPVARPFSTVTSRTGVPVRTVTPMRRASRSIARITAPVPPRGW